MSSTDLETVLRYHERTKHHFNRFAPGPGGLDWANQPDPFRRYAGAPLTRLPLLAPDEAPLSPAYESVYARGAAPVVPLARSSLCVFPGSRKWTCASMTPGKTCSPVASIVCAAAVRIDQKSS